MVKKFKWKTLNMKSTRRKHKYFYNLQVGSHSKRDNKNPTVRTSESERKH